MSLLVETYIFYVDVYFFQNLLIKCGILFLALYVNKSHFSTFTIKGVLKLVFVAALGTGIEIIGLGLGVSYLLFLLLVHIFEIPLLVRILLGKKKSLYGKVTIAGYFFVIVINGVLEILWNWFGDYYWELIGGACLIVYISLSIWMNHTRMKKGVFPVEITHGDRRIMLYGLYDSGNRLKDIYTKKGVHIISPRVIARLSLGDAKPVYIPYQALGMEQGLIEVYYLENIRIQKEQNTIEYEMVPVGVAEENLFQNKNYQMILNEEVW